LETVKEFMHLKSGIEYSYHPAVAAWTTRGGFVYKGRAYKRAKLEHNNLSEYRFRNMAASRKNKYGGYLLVCWGKRQLYTLFYGTHNNIMFEFMSGDDFKDYSLYPMFYTDLRIVAEAIKENPESGLSLITAYGERKEHVKKIIILFSDFMEACPFEECDESFDLSLLRSLYGVTEANVVRDKVYFTIGDGHLTAQDIIEDYWEILWIRSMQGGADEE
jgi:hypothetical protein